MLIESPVRAGLFRIAGVHGLVSFYDQGKSTGCGQKYLRKCLELWHSGSRLTKSGLNTRRGGSDWSAAGDEEAGNSKCRLTFTKHSALPKGAARRN